MITYTIEEGQLVRLYHDRPDFAWVLPDSESVTVLSADFVEISDVYADVISLSDGRCVIADTNELAEAYPSAGAALRGYNGQELRGVEE
jgi:predicted RNA-binding protein associated with RNAse of E/G family